MNRMALTARDKGQPATTITEVKSCGKMIVGKNQKKTQTKKTRFKINPTLLKNKNPFISVKNAANTPKYHYFASPKQKIFLYEV